MKTRSQCYLCGATEEMTRDHIPPKGFFVPPLPDDLITVPCCHACNDFFKKDDEAVRLFVSAYRWVSPKGKWVWKEKAVGSTLKRSPHLRRRILETLSHAHVQTSQGSELMPVLPFPKDRMERFLVRLTKGLLYTFHPAIDYKDMYFHVIQLTPAQEMADYMYENMAYDERGDGVFRFWRTVVDAEPMAPGLWTYVFYDGACFCVAHSKDESDITSG